MAAKAGILNFGAYIPRKRLSRTAIAQAHAWLAPQLLAKARGVRSMANWDEDSLTMGVEAARDLLGPDDDRSYVDSLAFATSTPPFADRLNAGVIATALTLTPETRTHDTTSSLRAGSGALIRALDAAKAGQQKYGLVIAADHRHTRAASPQEMDFGDGAAAFAVGEGEPIAEMLAHHSLTIDFVDHFRGADAEFDYNWEERWIRDEGYAKIVPQLLQGLFAKAKVKPEEVDHFIMPCLFARFPAALAKRCGIKPEAMRSNLAAEMGEAGCAHSLIMLAHALEEAKPKDKILLVQFSGGGDAILLEATNKITDKPAHRKGVTGHLALAQEETNYMKFLVFNELMEWDKGMRAEQDKKTALTTLYRHSDMILGLVGGRCTETGVIQFPRTRISVSPNNPAVDTQEPYKFAERQAKILSWSGDYLAFSIDPPSHYGMMVFDGGGRIMMDITDVTPGEVDTGMDVRMVFRVKDKDGKRGFTRYYWKATPLREA